MPVTEAAVILTPVLDWLDLVGVASYEMFIRGALDKIDAYPDMLHAGDFKTASNFYTETAFTPEHREMAVDKLANWFASDPEHDHHAPA